MKNLFVAHTPYHIILALGLSKVNNLINSDILIYKDFDIDNIDLDIYKSVFEKVYIYDRKNKKLEHKSKLEIITGLKKCIRSIGKLVNNEKYNNIYIFNDSVIETQYLLNNNIDKDHGKIIYVEDGSNAYLELKKSKSSKIKNLIKSLLYGFKYEEIGNSFGTYSKIKNRIVLWPDILRDDLKFDNKECKEIKKEILEEGLKFYSKSINYSIKQEEGVLILLEHIDFFKITENANLDKYIKSIEMIINKAKEQNINIIIKYHPRDTSKYIDEITNLYSDIYIAPNNIPAELYCMGKNMISVAIFSTSLFTNAKLTYFNNVISLLNIVGMEENQLVHKLEKIGIAVPKSIDELNALVNIKLN
ncbi:hypothetical protein HCG68_08930 [Paeniclostridium sordellii]|nr:hypothetical protein [Paeniclostridium sordellii]